MFHRRDYRTKTMFHSKFIKSLDDLMNLLYKMNEELDFIDMSDDFKFHFISTVQKFIESLQKLIVQPIADRLAQNLEIISENFQFGTRRTRILMRFIFYDLVVIVNPMGRILGF